jgi:glutamate carboxypeptidase
VNPSTLLDHCESHRDWLLAAVEALVRLESPSTDKTAVDRCGAELASRLEALGAEVTRLANRDRGDHIRAAFGTGRKQILLLGHFDTVWDVGQIARMPFEAKDGRLHGPGVFDMKSGIAVAMGAVRALTEVTGGGLPRIVMLWTTDEEIGSDTSRAHIEEEARRSEAVLVLEPSLPGGAVKTRRKGCGDFVLSVRGVSAHAGIDPGKGASAVHELAHQIVALEALQDLERGISVNVGLISGGTRTNVIAEEARATIDVRVPTMAEAARVEAAIRGLRPVLQGTHIEITGAIDRPPLERTEGVRRLYEQAREVAAALGRELGEGGTGGGSDGNFTAALGVPTLDGLGPAGGGAHALHEHVLLDELPWREAFVCGLMARLTGIDLIK